MRFARLFVVSCTAVLFAGALFTERTAANGNARHPQLVTDGGAPLPQPPVVADGGAPLEAQALRHIDLADDSALQLLKAFHLERRAAVL